MRKIDAPMWWVEGDRERVEMKRETREEDENMGEGEMVRGREAKKRDEPRERKFESKRRTWGKCGEQEKSH